MKQWNVKKGFVIEHVIESHLIADPITI